MALARYKAVDVFEHDGVAYGLGNALVLEESDAKDLVETGKIQFAQYLDPSNPVHASEIDRIRANPASFKAAKTGTTSVAETVTEAVAAPEEDSAAADATDTADSTDVPADAPPIEDKPATKKPRVKK